MSHPITHLSGTVWFLLTIANTETVLLASQNLKSDLDKYLDVCSKYKPGSSLTLAVVFNGLATYGPTDKLASLKCLTIGGSPAAQPIIDKFRSLHPHITVQNIYGSSEAGVILQALSPDKVHQFSVLANVEAKIVDLNTKEILPPNQSGMLWCKAPSVALGYYNNEEATSEAFVDGWQVTGDVAYWDDEGCFVIMDRVKQMMECMDAPIFTADLATLLTQDEDVLNAIVVAYLIPRFCPSVPYPLLPLGS